MLILINIILNFSDSDCTKLIMAQSIEMQTMDSISVEIDQYIADNEDSKGTGGDTNDHSDEAQVIFIK